MVCRGCCPGGAEEGFFSPTQSSTSTASSVTSARNILASLQSSQSTVNPNSMHSSTNVASVQPQFNAQTDKLNRKRAGSKRSFYKGKMPQVQVKEELRRLVALEYPGADVPEVDQFKDEMGL